MCLPGQPPAPPATAGEALSAISAGLDYLNAADVASLTIAEQAGCLRALEQATARHTAARATILAAFHAQDGCAGDGHGSTRTWLKWQTRISGGAASEAMGWMRRLSAHPAMVDALAGARITASWARHICDWTDMLPAEHRDDADQILLAAAAGGAELGDLAHLAEEIHRQTARPDPDDDDGFDDRGVHLAKTFRGAGKLRGDLTPQCAAALSAVLEALGKRGGPEDLRSKWQRDHDALEEAMRRLIASDCLPERAGQPTQIQLVMTLGQLRSLPGGGTAEAAWTAAIAGPGYDCDATIVPLITGHVDPQVLGELAATLLARLNPGSWHAAPGQAGPGGLADRDERDERDGEADAARRRLAAQALRQILLARAADLLSGPHGLAAYLRTGLLDGPAAAVSLPLDTGAATETIPAHLRRLVIARDQHCRFPGCEQPPAACQPHHLVPRSEGGHTCLTNLLLLCTFHHLIAVHRWGWGIVLLPDGTVTVTSPIDGRTLHSHGPPSQAA
ncbi:MAG TPA: DUF222 domain-containing protein [Streptosporangiaceae bacterium]|nr:DUF222 domain-containing protein [Streptosporangiaceae bacterium]